jgi:hypothetical protein
MLAWCLMPRRKLTSEPRLTPTADPPLLFPQTPNVRAYRYLFPRAVCAAEPLERRFLAVWNVADATALKLA